MKTFLRKNSALSLALLMLPGLAAGILFTIFFNRLNTSQIQSFIASFGFGAALIFIAIFTVRTFFVFAPYYIMVIIGGSMFGQTWGLVYNFIAVFLSASLAYVLSTKIRKPVLKRFNFDKNANYIAIIEKNGFKILLIMRLVLIFPFDMLNYAAGLAGMRYRKFILANIIGLAPEVVFLTCFGQSLKAPRSAQFIILLIILCVAVALTYRYRNKINNWIKSIT